MEPFSFIAGFLTFPMLVYAVLLLVLTIEVALEWGTVALITLVLSVIFARYFHPSSLQFITDDWHRVLLFMAAYLPVGMLWAVFKWWLYVNDKADEAESYLESQYGKQWPTNNKRYSEVSIPKVGSHKSHIMRWISWWPFSAFLFIFDRPLRMIITGIYNYMGETLQRIANNAYYSRGLIKKDL